MTQLNIPIPNRPVWSGPYEGGITQSMVNRFLGCPFRFYLYAYCGLEDNKPLDNRLMWGDTLHKGLEHLIAGDSLENATRVMNTYGRTMYPRSPRTYEGTTTYMLKLYSETALLNLQTFGKLNTEIHLELRTNEDVLLRGKADVVNETRTMLCDHKGKGTLWSPPDVIRDELNQDFQMNLYSYILGAQDWLYDLILIPEEANRLPLLRAGESCSEYCDRIFYKHQDPLNGFPIAKFWGKWINQVPYHQPKEVCELYYRRTIKPIIKRILRWWEYVNKDGFDPNNDEWYNEVFYISPIRLFDAARTPKFKCDYHSLLIGREDYSNLRKVHSYYPELEEK